MRFLRELGREVREVAVFLGAFHPPTVAHVALARAAGEHVDAVIWAMPEAFPHKYYEGVGRDERLAMVLEATADAVALTRENLFFAVAEEVSLALPGVRTHLLTGEDSARRLIEWDYGRGAEWKRRYLMENFERFPILTTRRAGDWTVPAEYASYFCWLDGYGETAEISSTCVRERIANGEEWRAMVPEALWARVAELYGTRGKGEG